MAITAIRTVIIYIVLIAALRLTGKRQLGQLQPIELVVTLLIADLASVPMQESGIPLLSGLIPIAVLVSLELILSALMLKSGKLSQFISGNPVIVIQNGVLQQQALSKLRLSVEDLSETLRQQGVFDMGEVQYAIAETNGSISVLPKPQYRPITAEDLQLSVSDEGVAVPIVSDGKFVQWGLSLCELNETWVTKTLQEKNCPLKEVLLLTSDRKRRLTLIRKQEVSS